MQGHFFLVCGCAIAPTPFVERLYFLYWVTFVSLSKTVWTYWCMSVPGFFILFQWPSLTYVSLSLLRPWSLDYWTKIWNEIDWSSLFFKIILPLIVCLPSQINFRIISSISIKSLGRIWVGIVLNLYMCLGKIDVILLSLPIHEESII